jgi:hypothetical protein
MRSTIPFVLLMKTPPLLLETSDKGTENLLLTMALSKESPTVAKITQISYNVALFAGHHAEMFRYSVAWC